MNEPTYATLFIILVLSAPLFYIVLSWQIPRIQTDEDYFLAGRQLAPHHFVGTTVAYGLQIAALTLFATWGYSHGFWTILVPLFWYLGYHILARFLHSGKLDAFVFQEHPTTIHQFIGKQSPLLAQLAMLASLIGITGPAMYEVDFVSRAIARLGAKLANQPDADAYLQWSGALFLCFVAMAAVYILRGGFRAVEKTDRWQLAVGYLAITIVLTALLIQVANTRHFWSALLLLTALTVVSLVLTAIWLRLFRGFNLGLLTLLASLLVYLFALLAIAPSIPQHTADLPSGLASFAEDQKLADPLSLGILPLLSLLVANGFYQFVDVSQWQRLASVRIINVHDETERVTFRQTISKSLLLAGFYSCSTWLIAIFLGMTLRYTTPNVKDNPFDALATFLLTYQDDISTRWIVLVFLVGSIAVMLSTIDSLVVSVAFTIRNDFLGPSTRTSRNPIFISRLVSGLYIAAASLAYLYLLPRFLDDASVLLYSCWASQIALFPVVLISLRLRDIGWVAFASVLIGMIAALVPFSFPKIGPLTLDPYQHSPLFALIAASAVVLPATWSARSTRAQQ